ncbi:MAG: hypothetical protein V1685_02145 [Parcubacteria group bacterium]
MSIPYWIIPLLYVIIVVIVLFASVFSFYHVFRFAPKNRVAQVSVYVYTALALAILVWTWIALQEVDWSQTIDIVFPTFS